MTRMTAAERRRIEAEERDRAVFAALAWPQEPCPQPWSKERVYEAGWTVSGSGDSPIRAWTYNAYSLRATYGSFDPYAHSTDDDRPRSKGQGGPWFATEVEARLAMRWAVCREMAETLHRLVEAEARAVVAEATA